MSWLGAAPLLLVTALWVLVPGAATTYALGLRGIAAWAAAPAVSVATIAVAAVVAGRLGVGWGPGTAAVAALVVAGVVLAVRLAGRQPIRLLAGSRRRDPAAPVPDDGARVLVAAALGTGAAALAATVTAIGGMGRPDALSHTYDAVFHYNAVARVLVTGDGSSLTLGAVTDPATGSFYPAAWHDLVALAAAGAQASIPAASNAVALVVAALVWPLGCLLLARQVAGPSVAAVLLAPVLATGFVGFPWSLMQFGVLWPNLLGLALLPVGLAALVALLGLGDRAMARGPALVLGGFAVVALGLAHPNAVFSLAAIGAAPVLWWVGARLPGLRWPGRVLLVGATAAVVVAVLAVVLVSPLLADLRSFDWPAYQSPAQAIGEVALNATNGRAAAWALSVVVIGGAVVAARRARTSWLVAAHVVSTLLFVFASALETAPAAALTAVWYNDSFRLAAMIPVTGVPLAVLGLLAAGRFAAERLPAAAALRRPGLGAVAAGVALVVASGGLYVREHAEVLAVTYGPQPVEVGLVTPAQRDFLDDLDLPAGSLVAQNPWNGSPLLPALRGPDVLFPHMQGRWSADALVVAQRLDEVATDPAVCAAVQRLGVTHVLAGGGPFWPWDARTGDYPGIDDVDTAPGSSPVPGAAPAPGFTLVASSAAAGYRLYRVADCVPSDAPA
ncbi:MAG: DUF6541 family protein [Pseudonocardia sp.]